MDLRTVVLVLTCMLGWWTTQAQECAIKGDRFLLIDGKERSLNKLVRLGVSESEREGFLYTLGRMPDELQEKFIRIVNGLPAPSLLDYAKPLKLRSYRQLGPAIDLALNNELDATNLLIATTHRELTLTEKRALYLLVREKWWFQEGHSRLGNLKRYLVQYKPSELIGQWLAKKSYPQTFSLMEKLLWGGEIRPHFKKFFAKHELWPLWNTLKDHVDGVKLQKALEKEYQNTLREIEESNGLLQSRLKYHADQLQQMISLIKWGQKQSANEQGKLFNIYRTHFVDRLTYTKGREALLTGEALGLFILKVMIALWIIEDLLLPQFIDMESMEIEKLEVEPIRPTPLSSEQKKVDPIDQLQSDLNNGLISIPEYLERLREITETNPSVLMHSPEVAPSFHFSE